LVEIDLIQFSVDYSKFLNWFGTSCSLLNDVDSSNLTHPKHWRLLKTVPQRYIDQFFCSNLTHPKHWRLLKTVPQRYIDQFF